jgi:hypothetical protein
MSASDALPVAAQDVLAVARPIAVAPHVDVGVASAGSAAAIDINVDSRTPLGPVSIAAPATDVDIDIGAPLGPASVATPSAVGIDVAGALLSAGSLLACLCASISLLLPGPILRRARGLSATIASAGSGGLAAFLATAGTGSLVFALLHLVQQSLGGDRLRARRERANLVSAYAKAQHRRGGAEY